MICGVTSVCIFGMWQMYIYQFCLFPQVPDSEEDVCVCVCLFKAFFGVTVTQGQRFRLLLALPNVEVAVRFKEASQVGTEKGGSRTETTGITDVEDVEVKYHRCWSCSGVQCERCIRKWLENPRQSHFLNLEGSSCRNMFGLQKTRVSHFLNHFLRLVVIGWEAWLTMGPAATWYRKVVSVTPTIQFFTFRSSHNTILYIS